MTDEYAKAVHDFARACEASTVEELIACLGRDPKAAAYANTPTIISAPPPLQLVDSTIRGPRPGDEVAPEQPMTQEWFVNAYVRDLARTLHIDLMAPPGPAEGQQEVMGAVQGDVCSPCAQRRRAAITVHCG